MERYDTGAVTAAARAAGVGELCWLTGPGRPPGAVPVVPLVLADRPTVAVPYARAGWAREVAASPRATLLLSDPRMSGSSWRPLAVTGHPALVEDPEGDVFVAQLVDEELRKYPPSRALADSPLLRRENWWYLPRLLLQLEVDGVRGIARRARDEVVRVADWEADPLDLAPVGRAAEGPRERGPAVLLGHDFSVPDLERWSAHTTTGELDGRSLRVLTQPPSRELEKAPGLLTRLRRQRELKRACVEELRLRG